MQGKGNSGVIYDIEITTKNQQKYMQILNTDEFNEILKVLQDYLSSETSAKVNINVSAGALFEYAFIDFDIIEIETEEYYTKDNKTYKYKTTLVRGSVGNERHETALSTFPVQKAFELEAILDKIHERIKKEKEKQQKELQKLQQIKQEVEKMIEQTNTLLNETENLDKELEKAHERLLEIMNEDKKTASIIRKVVDFITKPFIFVKQIVKAEKKKEKERIEKDIIELERKKSDAKRELENTKSLRDELESLASFIKRTVKKARNWRLRR